MDLMQEHDDDLNRKVILLSVGSAVVAALLIALARRKEDYIGEWLPEPLCTSPDVADDMTTSRGRSGSKSARS